MTLRTRSFKDTEKSLLSLKRFAEKTQKKTISSRPEKYFSDNQNIFIKSTWTSAYTHLDVYFGDLLTNIQDSVSHTLVQPHGLPMSLFKRERDDRAGRNDIIRIIGVDVSTGEIASLHSIIHESWKIRNEITHRNSNPGKTLLDVINEIDTIVKYLKMIDRQAIKTYSKIRTDLI